MTRLTIRTLRRPLTTTMAIALSAGALGAAGGSALALDASGVLDARSSDRLTSDAQVEVRDDRNGAAYTPEQARALAARFAGDIPLPLGGTFDGVRWETAGTLGEAEIRSVLQYNAACQWMRAQRDGREAGTARTVLSEVPAWSAFRGTEVGASLGRAIEQQLDGGGGEAADALLAECDSSHEREVRYAREMGEVPST